MGHFGDKLTKKPLFVYNNDNRGMTLNQELKNLHVNLKYKTIDLEQECNELCQYFIEELNVVRGKNISKITKSLSLTPLEKEIFDAFCEENNTKLPNVVRCIFWRDEALPDALVVALSKEKLANLDFLSLKDFTFEYLRNYDNLDEEDYRSSMKEKAKTYSIQDRILVVKSVEKHYINKGFETYSSYLKIGLIALGIFPKHIIDLIYNNLRSAKKETNSSKKFQTVKKINSVKVSISVLPFEQNLFNNFKKNLIDTGLTFSMIVKYRLLQEEIIDHNMVNFTSSEIEKCGVFTCVKPQISNTTQYYQDLRTKEIGKKRTTNNVSITQEIKSAIKYKIQKGTLASWIRNNVLDYYGVYPIATDTSKSIVELYLKY